MTITIGIDEVGRGSIAGPLLVGAVALDADIKCPADIRDSKKLSKKKRQLMATWVKENALSYGLGWVTAPEIDSLGMTKSLKLAARRAYNQLSDEAKTKATQIAIDGNIMMLDDSRAFSLIKGDDKVRAISAASIIAKVTRDYYMTEKIALEYPKYGFENHVGYGTKAHIEAIEKYGPVAGLHRFTFQPVKRMVSGSSPKIDKVSGTAGRRAETVAAEYLEDRGYHIIVRNWKTRECEIDIVASKGEALCFVEVKYREDNKHGDGVAAITSKKLAQMKFSARVYLHHYGLDKTGKTPDIKLLAMSLHGDTPVVDAVIDIAD